MNHKPSPYIHRMKLDQKEKAKNPSPAKSLMDPPPPPAAVGSWHEARSICASLRLKPLLECCVQSRQLRDISVSRRSRCVPEAGWRDGGQLGTRNAFIFNAISFPHCTDGKIHMYKYLYSFTYTSFSLSVYLHAQFIYLSIYLMIYLSIYLSTYVCV